MQADATFIGDLGEVFILKLLQADVMGEPGGDKKPKLPLRGLLAVAEDPEASPVPLQRGGPSKTYHQRMGPEVCLLQCKGLG